MSDQRHFSSNSLSSAVAEMAHRFEMQLDAHRATSLHVAVNRVDIAHLHRASAELAASAPEPCAGPWEVFYTPLTAERGVLNEEVKLVAHGPFHGSDEKREYCERLAAMLNRAAQPPGANAVNSVDYWQQRGYTDAKFRCGDAVMFNGKVESVVVEVRERQYVIGGGTVAWEHELRPSPTKGTGL